ncbi:hypothetical protein JYU34_013327 [Plutella xylostella]|uniref:Tetraspanin n=1 Tax=Plutella xylostella TaxID=51655 RepID=A0ABQ7QAJ9_PLUXY|nr:hypothetical protein JYU34_013327 [Plutella xylostella]
MGCGEFIVKYVLFFANLFFALAGLALLGVGAAVQWQVKPLLDVFDGSFEVAPISAMVVGGVVFLIAFFGCCGSLRESNCMLVTYAVFMIMLMILKITLASLIFVNLGAVTDQIPRWLNAAFNQPNLDEFHQIETTFTCCGTVGGSSYVSLSLPPSCCTVQPCTVLNAHPGCNDVLTEFFRTFGMVIGLLAIAVVSVELVAVVFALCLANRARNYQRRSRY